MIVLNLVTETLNFLNSGTTINPTYCAIGTGSTTETQIDTALVTEVSRLSTSITKSSPIASLVTIVPSTTSALYTQNIRETGSYSASIAGTMFDRSVSPTGITFDAATNLKITKFYAFGTTNLNPNKILTDGLLSGVIDYVSGTDAPPTYTAYGTALVIDRFESLGAGPNAWVNGGQASAPTLNTTDYQSGINSMNMGKTGAATATFDYTRTLAATVDLSSTTFIKFWLNIYYVADLNKLKAIGALQIRLGSDAGNYKYYSLDRSNLHNGWYNYEISMATFSSSGAPVMAAIDYIGFFFETTNAADTITHGNLYIDYLNAINPILASTNSMSGEIVRNPLTSAINGYTLELTDTLTGAQGNTYNYEYFALFDAAATGDMYYIIKTPRIVKNSAIQINTSINVVVTIE